MHERGSNSRRCSQDRLHLYGLDLRDLSAVGMFLAHVKLHYADTSILINNAAQSVRRPPAYYRDVFASEQEKQRQAESKQLDRWEAALVKVFAGVNGAPAPKPFVVSDPAPPRITPTARVGGRATASLPAATSMVIEEVGTASSSAAKSGAAGDEKKMKIESKSHSSASRAPPVTAMEVRASAALELFTGSGALTALPASQRSAALTQVPLLPSDALSEAEATQLFPKGELDARYCRLLLCVSVCCLGVAGMVGLSFLCMNVRVS
jgi:hypothetical protein